MDLFRRLFGKTGEETPLEQKPSPKADTENNNFDGIDSVTQPVTAYVAAGQTAPLPALDGVTQPLTSDTLNGENVERVIFGQSTDIGQVRSNNQDAAISMFFSSHSVEDKPDFGLFVVADGMGGHHDGEKASAIATRVIAGDVANTLYLPLLNTPSDGETEPINEALIASVKKANAEVIKHVPEGGTTVTAAAVIGSYAHVVHVGDSRAYLVTKDGIEQITRDHSLVQRLIELDQLTPEEAERHPQKNVLYRALGQNETLEVDTLTRRLPSDSVLLICSDGLWGQVEEREIYEIAMNNTDPQQACDKLVALANTHGGLDNITVILLRIQ